MPTRAANMWYAQKAVFVEAAGKIREGGHVDQDRQAAAAGQDGVGGGQGAGAACGAGLHRSGEPDASGGNESLAAMARTLRSRLGEISQTLGINLPVYVLFTKMDRVPFFAEFVRNLTNEEAAQVLGVTVPIETARERRVRRNRNGAADRSLRTIVPIAGNARVRLFAREHEPPKLPGLLRISARVPEAASQPGAVPGGFMPSEPVDRGSVPARILFLRGAARGGAGGGARHAWPQQRRDQRAALGATGMFMWLASGGDKRRPRNVVGTRRVPQWVFPPPLLPQAALGGPRRDGREWRQHQDQRAAPDPAGDGSRAMSVLRRCATVSYFKNRRFGNRGPGCRTRN